MCYVACVCFGIAKTQCTCHLTSQWNTYYSNVIYILYGNNPVDVSNWFAIFTTKTITRITIWASTQSHGDETIHIRKPYKNLNGNRFDHATNTFLFCIQYFVELPNFTLICLLVLDDILFVLCSLGSLYLSLLIVFYLDEMSV